MNELMNKINLMDCKKGMECFPDKFFDLAIVDPPYGIDEIWAKQKSDQFYYHRSSYKNNEIPDEEYFQQLMRVSKNQIIWGANYYQNLWPSNHLIIWDKGRNWEKTHMSECEIAWHSFNIPCRKFYHQWDGGKKQTETGIIKIHPFQKPVNLYRWLLQQYAASGDKILDTHAGSASSLVACWEEGFEFCGFEIDEGYYLAACNRLEQVRAQGKLFEAV